MSKLILPCAGYGKRMNMAPDQSKELLLYKGVPLIENFLTLAKFFDITPLVITRKEKTDLIQYCFERNVETLVVDVKGEWASTVLQSEPFWDKHNILMLPDTSFSPAIEATEGILKGLALGNKAVIALHEVQDASKWGIIDEYTLTEKPCGIDGTTVNAWGIIGFHTDYGNELFSHSERKESIPLTDTGFVYLDTFRDLTRTGIIG